MDIAGEALDDSDKLYDVIFLIMDRCGGDMNTLTPIRAMIFNSLNQNMVIMISNILAFIIGALFGLACLAIFNNIKK